MSDEKTRAQQQFELDFEEFLRDDASQLVELYRKLPLAAPDAQLDARVRALAQRELALSDEAGDTRAEDEGANLTPTRMFLRHPRWLPALSAAAMLVLAAGIAWRMAPSGWTTREHANAPAATAPATTTAAHVEDKARLNTATNAERATNSTSPATVSKPAAPALPSAVTPNQSDTLAKAVPSEPVRTKAAANAPHAQSEPQAFPTAPTPKEVQRRREEKVESAAPATRYAAPSPPAPPAAGAPAVETAPAPQSSRADAISAKQASPQDASAAAGSVLHETARAAPKSAAASQPSMAGNVQSSIASCPVSPGGNNWRGHYPPEIPPTPQLRRETVKNLLGEAHRDEARRAYADFHARCPGDSWPPDILNQLQAQ